MCTVALATLPDTGLKRVSAETIALWLRDRLLSQGRDIPLWSYEAMVSAIQELLDQGIIGDFTGGELPASVSPIDEGPFPDDPPASTLEPD